MFSGIDDKLCRYNTLGGSTYTVLPHNWALRPCWPNVQSRVGGFRLVVRSAPAPALAPSFAPSALTTTAPSIRLTAKGCSFVAYWLNRPSSAAAVGHVLQIALNTKYCGFGLRPVIKMPAAAPAPNIIRCYESYGGSWLSEHVRSYQNMWRESHFGFHTRGFRPVIL